MSGNSLVLIVIAIIAIVIAFDYLRLHREIDKPKPRATFSERAQQNPKAFLISNNRPPVSSGEAEWS